MLPEDVALAMGLARAQAQTRRRLEAALERHALSYTEFTVLAELSGVLGERLRPVDLADRLRLTPSGIARALPALERKGWIARDAHERDARAGYARLTDEGRTALERALADVSNAAARGFAGVTRADRLALLGLFERLDY